MAINNFYKSLSILMALSICFSSDVSAKTFSLPANGDVVGHVSKLNSSQLQGNDNFLTLSERLGIGFHELEEANPSLDPWSSGYGTIIVPNKYVLPKVRRGIVINLAELRLYYFPAGSNEVRTYPVGIGKKDWSTPVLTTSVVSKVKNPTWTVPKSIKIEYEKRGETIANSIPPGPNNPLGKYAIKLGAAGYLLHGSNSDVGVGLRVSHGCIRLFNGDIEELFSIVPVGTPVTIINEPYKIGHDGKNIYLEAHKPLSEDQGTFSYNKDFIRSRLQKLNTNYKIDWNVTEEIASELRGIPAPIGVVN